MINVRVSRLAALVGLACAGCATHDRQVDSLPQFLPPPTNAAAAPQPDYRIAAFDTLQVTVLNVAELSGIVQVSGSGDILVPLAGNVHAADMTPHELARSHRKCLPGTVYPFS